MRRTGTVQGATLAAVLALALCLSGCVPESPTAPATPSPSGPASGAPVFASDEEALAAAEEAYRAYLAAVAAISSDGGSDSGRIGAHVTNDRLEKELDGFDYLASNAFHATGKPELREMVLQNRSSSALFTTITVYACVDVSSVRILDAGGTDVTPADRPDVQSLHLDFFADRAAVLLSESETWSGTSPC